MTITHLDRLVSGGDDVPACNGFPTEFGLTPVMSAPEAGWFATRAGTGWVIRRRDDPAPPQPLPSGTMRRQTVSLGWRIDRGWSPSVWRGRATGQWRRMRPAPSGGVRLSGLGGRFLADTRAAIINGRTDNEA